MKNNSRRRLADSKLLCFHWQRFSLETGFIFVRQGHWWNKLRLLHFLNNTKRVLCLAKVSTFPFFNLCLVQWKKQIENVFPRTPVTRTVLNKLTSNKVSRTKASSLSDSLSLNMRCCCFFFFFFLSGSSCPSGRSVRPWDLSLRCVVCQFLSDTAIMISDVCKNDWCLLNSRWAEYQPVG